MDFFTRDGDDDDDDDDDSDDDEDNFFSQQLSQSLSQNSKKKKKKRDVPEEKHCDVCGGNNFYLDNVSNKYVCTGCYTQSQVYDNDHNDEVSMEDALNLVAKTGGGRVKFMNTGGNTGRKLNPMLQSFLTSTYTTSKQPKSHAYTQAVNEVDSAMKLPSIDICLQGMQSVLYNGIKQLCKILQFDRQIQDDSIAIVKHLWLSYLRSWVDAAEYYSPRYPMIRFCFRDYFLSSHRSQYIRHSLIQQQQEKQQQEKQELEKVSTAAAAAIPNRSENGIQPPENDDLIDTESDASKNNNSTLNKSRRKGMDDDTVDSVSSKEDDDSNDDDEEEQFRFLFDGRTTEKNHAKYSRSDRKKRSSIRKKRKKRTTNASLSDHDDDDRSDNNDNSVDGTDDDPKKNPVKSKKPKRSDGPTKRNKKRDVIAAIDRVTKESILHRTISHRQMLSVHYNKLRKQHFANKNSNSKNSAVEIRYREAALLVQPSMNMVCTMLWMAVNHSGRVSSCQLCDWVRAGKIPIMNAYRHSLHDDDQRAKLRVCQTFFQMEDPPSPTVIEDMATILMIACRARRVDEDSNAAKFRKRLRKVTAKKDRKKEEKSSSFIRLWPTSCLPSIVAQTVAKAGLDQSILDRTLSLAGIVNRCRSKNEQFVENAEGTETTTTSSNHEKNNNKSLRGVDDNDTLPVPIIDSKSVTRTEEILALIAIACQLDPNWRSMKYFSNLNNNIDNSTTPSIPWNEAQFRYTATNGNSINAYLDFIENIVVQQKETSIGASNDDGSYHDDAIKDENSMSHLPKEYWAAYNNLQQHNNNNDDVQSIEMSKSDEDNMNNEVRPCRFLAGTALSEQDEDNTLSANDLKGDKMDSRCIDTSYDIFDVNISWKKKNYRMDDYSRMDRYHRDWEPHRPNYTSGTSGFSYQSDPQHDLLIQYLAYTGLVDPLKIQKTYERYVRRLDPNGQTKAKRTRMFSSLK